MTALKLRKIGNSVGVVFPTETLSFMRVSVGDLLHVTEAPGGGVRLSPFDPEFEKQMTLARTIMKENRDALRELAK